MDNQMLEYVSWGFVGLALWGSIYNSKLDQAKAFKIWFITNLFFVMFNAYFEHYGVAALYACHWLLTINGLKNIRDVTKIIK